MSVSRVFELLSSRNSEESTAEYRPDIDGLRAVAALSVLGFHAGWLKGGGVGVDIFFVISGFLISGVIFRALRKQRFSFVDFYMRRVKRIFPALIALLIAVWAAGWLILTPGKYSRLGSDIAAGAGFVQNFWFYNTMVRRTQTPDYLIGHLWTLGVEEQFYLFWPIFVWAIWRLGKGQFFLIIVVTTVSFIAYVSMAPRDMMMAWLLPWNRLWELSIGGALAYAQLPRTTELNRALVSRFVQGSGLSLPGVHSLGIIGGVCIVVSVFGLLPSEVWPVSGTLVPSVGSLMLIAAGQQFWLNRYVLSARPMVAVGLISYPLYLWHFPLFLLVAIFQGEMSISEYQNVPLVMKVGATAGSLGLAYLTYRYLELPLRNSAHTKQIASVLCVLMMLCGGIAFVASR